MKRRKINRILNSVIVVLTIAEALYALTCLIYAVTI